MLQISGVNIDELVKKVGSPIYVYDEYKLDQNLKEYHDNFVSADYDTEVIYASKAFCCVEMLKLAAKAGIAMDVVSGGELYTAKKANFDMRKVYFHGNNKTDDEITMALEYGVKTLIVDNVHEIDRIEVLSDERNQNVDVLIRINPKISAHTHEYIQTASVDSKFGISIDDVDDIKTMIDQINESKHISFKGFHSHIGSQIFGTDAFEGTIEKMIDFISKNDFIVDTLDFGGGFGIRYVESDQPTPIKEVCRNLIDAVDKNLKKHKVKINKLCIEPGRSMVGESGYTIYKVGFIKKTKNKQFVFIDGGMADNIRPALYGAEYACDIANKLGEPKLEKYEIAGKCCESGDILIHDAKLPHVDSGDILVVYSTGAYGYTMSSNYNRLNRPPVVFCKNGHARIVIKGETYEDQLRNETDEAVL